MEYIVGSKGRSFHANSYNVVIIVSKHNCLCNTTAKKTNCCCPENLAQIKEAALSNRQTTSKTNFPTGSSKEKHDSSPRPSFQPAQQGRRSSRYPDQPMPPYTMVPLPPEIPQDPNQHMFQYPNSFEEMPPQLPQSAQSPPATPLDPMSPYGSVPYPIPPYPGFIPPPPMSPGYLPYTVCPEKCCNCKGAAKTLASVGSVTSPSTRSLSPERKTYDNAGTDYAPPKQLTDSASNTDQAKPRFGKLFNLPDVKADSKDKKKKKKVNVSCQCPKNFQNVRRANFSNKVLRLPEKGRDGRDLIAVNAATTMSLTKLGYIAESSDSSTDSVDFDDDYPESRITDVAINCTEDTIRNTLPGDTKEKPEKNENNEKQEENEEKEINGKNEKQKLGGRKPSPTRIRRQKQQSPPQRSDPMPPQGPLDADRNENNVATTTPANPLYPPEYEMDYSPPVYPEPLPFPMSPHPSSQLLFDHPPNLYNPSPYQQASPYPTQPQSAGLNPQYPQSQYPESQYPESQYPQSQYPQSQYPQPQYPQSQYPQTQYPQSQYPQSQYPQSQYPQSQYPQSQYPQSQYPQSQYPQSQYPQSQYPQSQYPQSQYPQSQYPQSQYPQSQYPQSQYPQSQYPGSQYPQSQYSPPQYPQSQYPQSQYPQTQYPQSQYPQTQYPQSQYPQSQYPQSQFPQSQYPQSPYPQSQYPQSQYPQSQYPQSQYPQSQYPKSQYPQSQYPQSQYPQSQYPQSQYPQSQYPPSQHPVPKYPAMQHPNPEDPPLTSNCSLEKCCSCTISLKSSESISSIKSNKDIGDQNTHVDAGTDYDKQIMSNTAANTDPDKQKDTRRSSRWSRMKRESKEKKKNNISCQCSKGWQHVRRADYLKGVMLGSDPDFRVATINAATSISSAKLDNTSELSGSTESSSCSTNFDDEYTELRNIDFSINCTEDIIVNECTT